MLVAIKFGTLVRLIAVAAVVLFILFLSLTRPGSTDPRTPPPPAHAPAQKV